MPLAQIHWVDVEDVLDVGGGFEVGTEFLEDAAGFTGVVGEEPDVVAVFVADFGDGGWGRAADFGEAI